MVYPSILLLPSELKHYIAELSTRSSLVALSQSHPGLREEAERVLYRSLFIRWQDCRGIETLATNPHKAGFVHFLTSMELFGWPESLDHAMPCLLQSLVNMHALTDFRLKIDEFDIGHKSIQDLNKILCGDHFRLKTLYCSGDLDISEILQSQMELQIFGLYDAHPLFLEQIHSEQIHSPQLHLPMVLIYLEDCWGVGMVNLSIFPAFYSLDRWATIPQVLAKSMNKELGSSYTLDTVFGFHIYLIDSSDMPSIYSLAKNMSESFPRITLLYFYFQDEIPLQPEETREIFSLFPNMQKLEFLWSWDLDAQGNSIS